MSTPPAPAPLTGLAAAVTEVQIRSLLLERAPSLFTDSARHALLVEVLRGVGAEVTQLLGAEPAAGTVHDLATWAVALGAAANIESALFPEQQFGDAARAQLLQARYLGVRAQLQAAVDAGGVTTPGGAGPGAAHGGFHPVPGWPDPSVPRLGAVSTTGAEAGWLS